MDVTFRPIERWPEAFTEVRRTSQFSASYGQTLELLDRELVNLDAEAVVIQLDLDERDIRLDGRPRVSARPGHPGVIVAFESRYGPLQYATDVFDRWQHNLRAIALGLEALRKVDRYGITRRGEQYTGWRAIESGGETTDDFEAAVNFIRAHSDIYLDADQLDQVAFGRATRKAAMRLHPDQGGDAEQFQRLQRARQLIEERMGW